METSRIHRLIGEYPECAALTAVLETLFAHYAHPKQPCKSRNGHAAKLGTLQRKTEIWAIVFHQQIAAAILFHRNIWIDSK